MRRLAATLLLLSVMSVHAAPLARSVTDEACGHCASKCCCRLPGTTDPAPRARLVAGCPGGATQEAAGVPTLRPAVLPPSPETAPPLVGSPRPPSAPIDLLSLTPVPASPPPRTL